MSASTRSFPARAESPFSQPMRTFALLAGVVFVAHFLLLKDFGLYEDDYFYTLPILKWSWATWWDQTVAAIVHPVQGRPLFLAAHNTLLFLAMKSGGLEAAYLASWALISLNAWLMYRLLEKTVSPVAAITGALLFIVYPLDTSRQILMHQMALHGGMCMLLTALNLYVGGWRITAFFVAAAGLLNYESFYLPFIVAPLLLARRERPTVLSLCKHVGLFFGIAFAMLLARRFLGESRAAEVLGSLGEIITKMIYAPLIGVWSGLKSVFLRPTDAFLHASPYAWVLGLLVAALAFRWLFRASSTEAPSPPQAPSQSNYLIWIAAGGVIAWLVSYLLAFRPDYYPPIVSIGRLTGVHTPGAIGCALVFGVLAEFIRAHGHRWLRSGVLLGLSLLIGFSTAFGVQIQQSEYAAHWNKQKLFYQQLIALVGDLREGETVVLNIEGDAAVLPITQGFPRFGSVNYTPLAFAQYVTWPATWQTSPQLASVWDGCPVKQIEDKLALFTPPWRFTESAAAKLSDLPKDVPVISDGNFIYLHAKDGILQRVSGPVSIRGFTLQARAPDQESPRNVAPSPLFQELASEFAPPASWFTLRDARNYPR